jgi:hypothetical protein
MPLLSRPTVRTYVAFCALSLLAIFCANPSAAEPTTIALLRPQPILTQIKDCSAACRHERQTCVKQMNYIASREAFCDRKYNRCMNAC